MYIYFSKMKLITGLLVVVIFAAFISSAKSKSLKCYECGKGDACYFSSSNATTNFGSSISCQEDESCFTLITHSTTYDIYERGCKKPEKLKNSTDCQYADGKTKTTTCYCKSKDNCNDQTYKMVMTTAAATTTTTTTTTKSTTTPTATTTSTTTTTYTTSTAGKTLTANPTNTTTTTSAS